MYPASLKFDFDNDRDGIIKQITHGKPDDVTPNQNYIVSCMPSTLIGDYFFFKCIFFLSMQYATKVTKFDRRGYKPRERILVLTAESISIVEKIDKTKKPKDHLPLAYVTCLQMTSGTDNFLLIKVSEQLENCKVRSIIHYHQLLLFIITCLTHVSKLHTSIQFNNINNFIFKISTQYVIII